MQEKSPNVRRGNPKGRSKGDASNAGSAGKGRGARSREGKGWARGQGKKE